MDDLVKIRNKKTRNAGLPPAEDEVPPPSPVEAETSPESPPEVTARDAAKSAGETPALRDTAKLDRFKAEAGKRRAFEAAKKDDAFLQNQLELLTFVMADEQYAVDIERIVEIVTPRAVTRIPNADSSVVGIISLRGT